jgi:hypothetical protein
MARPLVKLNSVGPDVLDAILRLNLAGADPQVEVSQPFSAAAKVAAEAFQAGHGLQVDGDIGDNTWTLLDQLDGGRLITAADVDAIFAQQLPARALLEAGEFDAAAAILDPMYANPGVPPEVRASVVAQLGWVAHGRGEFERARALYFEQLAIIRMLGGQPLAERDTIQRLREITLGEPPGPPVSFVNRQNLPPNG